jgi:hypothetical protein
VGTAGALGKTGDEGEIDGPKRHKLTKLGVDGKE